MATRLKTIEYWFPVIPTLADATPTNAAQITIYLPESGTKTFHKVIADVVVADQFTTASNITQRNLEIQLGTAGYSAVNNVQTLTNSGENIIHTFSGDFTSYFTTNWTGTSMTADCRLTINTSTIGSANASVRLSITYEFDDTAPTHVKTVWIPLNVARTNLGTTKSIVADTIPALDTYCPEASKIFRQMTVVVQGNQESNATTDMSMSMEVDALGAYTSTTYEKNLNSSGWYRLNMDCTAMTTNSTHSLYLWASITDFDHPHVYLVVTYEFDPSATTSILNSIVMPMEFNSPIGDSATTFQRATRDLWIQEPDTITTQRVALYVHYDQLAPIANLNARVGTGSFLAYTSVASMVCGGCGFMVRNDSAFTLTRGRNTLQADIYRIDTADLGHNVSGWWIINYTSGVPTQGIWSANHTVRWNLKVLGTSAHSIETIVAASSPTIPETVSFRNAIGIHYVYVSNSTGISAGAHIGVERLAAEGGFLWESIYSDIGASDPEVGIRQVWANARSVFKRWTNDVSDRIDLQTDRRYRISLSQRCSSYDYLDMYITYHSITFTVLGNITNSNGGTVNISLHRTDTGEKVLETARVGDGAYSFTWFDNTENVYAVAYEDGAHLGRSDDGLAT